MSVEVVIPPSLQSILNGVKSIEVDGLTVGACLENLVAKHPQLKSSLFGKSHRVQKGFTIFVNKETIQPDSLLKPVNAGDKIYIMNILVGG